MPTAELIEWVKSLLIGIISIIIAWEKAKKWHFKKNGRDRRTPNPHPDLGYELGKLYQAFKSHEKNDDHRTNEIKAEVRHIREEQGRQAVTIGVLKSKVNS